MQAAALACLVPDFKQLVKGEETLIGERGSNLSGGQKARVSLARAIYADGDVFLLDDPLSAVDPRVSGILMDECICGALANKTRLLVTHRLQFLSRVDKLLFLN